MPRQQYPFYRFRFPDGSLTPAWRLYLPLRITNPATSQSVMVYGLADTGADATLFPAALATQVGHVLKGTGVRSNITCGIEQNHVTTYRHTFTLELLRPDGGAVLRKFRGIEVDCAESNPPVLLGASDFLVHFNFSVRYKVRELVLEW